MSDNAILRTDTAAPAPGRIIAFLLLAAALVALPFAVKALGQPALVPLATRALIYAIAAASLNLALGFGGMVSFGHAAFFGALIVGLVDTSLRAFAPGLLRHVMTGSEADALGAGLASMGIYLLMAIVLLVRPKGLFPAHV